LKISELSLNRITDNLDPIAESVRNIFTAQDRSREKALPLCREIIRHASLAIRAIHRREYDHAVDIIEKARLILESISRDQDILKGLANTNFIRDAQKEYAEAVITLSLVKGEALAAPTDLDIDAAAYLNGMGEAASELRRYLLDSIRNGDLSRCEELLAAMDEIYGTLVTIDFPDAITGGLRRTTDMLRGVLEKTRSDLTVIMRQQELADKLAVLEQSRNT
jgi:translin